MQKIISVLMLVILASCYFFPVEFLAFPGVNTKMILAAFSIPIIMLQFVYKGVATTGKDTFQLFIMAMIVSLICLFSVTYNGTDDHSYTAYIVSMLVWMGGAYTFIQCVKHVHQYVTLRLVCNYLITVCVAQCIIAYLMSIYPSLMDIADRYIGGEAFMGNVDDRLHGIGCALDVAGLRFSAVLAIISFLIVHAGEEHRKDIVWYIIAFIIIFVIGSMIARSTIAGAVVGLGYILYATFFIKEETKKKNKKKFWTTFVGLVLVVIPMFVFLYKTNQNFHQNIRFGFEGFFSLFEKGEWQTGSNDILLNMIVLPEDLKTWIIGDGYMENPMNTDPYYVGEVTGGYYKGTDIGYLRFIFYFGLTGLVMFILYFINVMKVCCRRFPAYSIMFIMILAVNFIGWLKVSTDIFLVFALFLCISETDYEKYDVPSQRTEGND